MVRSAWKNLSGSSYNQSLGYLELLILQGIAKVVITDSDGIQEGNTERRFAIFHGTNVLMVEIGIF